MSIRRAAPIVAIALTGWSNWHAASWSEDCSEENFVYAAADGLTRVYAPTKLDVEAAKKITERVKRAYDFDVQREQWKNALAIDCPIKLNVDSSLSEETIAFAQGRNLLVVGAKYIFDDLADGTLAHELTHIQDNRHLSKLRPPEYFLEGRALSNGYAYRFSQGNAPVDYDMALAHLVKSYTEVDARDVMSEPNCYTHLVDYKKVQRMSYIGAYFIEFLRTRVNGKGFADVHPRSARVIELMGHGETYKEAFREEFGIGLDGVLQQFYKLMEDTQGSPKDRLIGTIYEGL